MKSRFILEFVFYNSLDRVVKNWATSHQDNLGVLELSLLTETQVQEALATPHLHESNARLLCVFLIIFLFTQSDGTFSG